LDAAVAALQRIAAQMSLFREDSPLTRLNRDGRLAAAPAGLLGVLGIATGVARGSGGACDATEHPQGAAAVEARQRAVLAKEAHLGLDALQRRHGRIERDAQRDRILVPGLERQRGAEADQFPALPRERLA
ncbi:MAG: FAD:protein FMN transferase, partial [Caulobacter sp.]|nr:FAD:protein FMN transferase [Vitreoscilla sp.]